MRNFALMKGKFGRSKLRRVRSAGSARVRFGSRGKAPALRLAWKSCSFATLSICPAAACLADWPEGSSYLGFIFARGKTPEEVETALRQAHAKLQFTLTPRLPVEHPVT